ncbi:MAG TPA: M20/M25/M40 family metallo-hydrolase [Gemmatimonadaceae bacterium]|nr:M20/M25/M40 family metallo-hydrolase [Gemmatimonadaceae bacterium]
MKKLFVIAGFVVASFHSIPLSAQTPIADQYRPAANRIIAAAMADSSAWNRLAEMTDKFGHRLSGSESLERTIDWILVQMKNDGLENVHGEKVMVPHWVRGAESATLISPRAAALHMIGLGRSVGTPARGITAPVMIVSSFDDLTKRAAEAKGKIVLFDVPFTSYGATVRYRGGAASAAARVGAVAALIRSVSSYSIQNPHTGAMNYDTTVKAKIPAAALSVEDALMLHRMVNRGERVVVNLKMGAKTLPDAPSRNIIAEIRGSEKPDEVVVLGGHIDSWDVGTGAMDDGGGVVAAWEAVKLIKKLGLKPRRTIRVVAWTNEENGSKGGTGYRDAHRAEMDKHVLAMESDNGVFDVQGLGISAGAGGLATAQDIASLLTPIGANKATEGGSDADTDPLNALGVPTISPNVDGTRYFWFHHSSGDTMDKIDPREMAENVAFLAVTAFVAADMPGYIPRSAIRVTGR